MTDTKNLEQLYFDFIKHDERVSDKVKRKLGNPFITIVDNVTDAAIGQIPDCLTNLICYNGFPPERWNAIDKEMRLHRLYQIAAAFTFFTTADAHHLGIFIYSIMDFEINKMHRLF